MLRTVRSIELSHSSRGTVGMPTLLSVVMMASGSPECNSSASVQRRVFNADLSNAESSTQGYRIRGWEYGRLRLHPNLSRQPHKRIVILTLWIGVQKNS